MRSLFAAGFNSKETFKQSFYFLNTSNVMSSQSNVIVGTYCTLVSIQHIEMGTDYRVALWPVKSNSL